MNVHAPERQPGETPVQYRGRRLESRGILLAATRVYGGKKTSRELRRDNRRENGSKHGDLPRLKGVYGAGLKAHFDHKFSTFCAQRAMRRLTQGMR